MKLINTRAELAASMLCSVKRKIDKTMSNICSLQTMKNLNHNKKWFVDKQNPCEIDRHIHNNFRIDT